MRRWKAVGVAALLMVTGIGSVVFATAASANTLDISISCTSVTFSYGLIPGGGGTGTETISVNGSQTVQQSVTIPPGGSSDTVPYSGGVDGANVSASATFTTSDGTFTNSASMTLSGCGNQPPPQCPPGTKLNFRWHYRANGSSGSWSGTKSVILPGNVDHGSPGDGGRPQGVAGHDAESGVRLHRAGQSLLVLGDGQRSPSRVRRPLRVGSDPFAGHPDRSPCKRRRTRSRTATGIRAATNTARSSTRGRYRCLICARAGSCGSTRAEPLPPR